MKDFLIFKIVAKEESLCKGSLNGIFFTNVYKKNNTSLTTTINHHRSHVVLVEEENNSRERSVESLDVDDFLNLYHPHMNVKDRKEKLQH